ncbi:MAG TPA: hypothetical protein VLW84_03215 [Terriglobales bacterium]|nr:hypothetical protein [Terriglobales bacterium]
MHHRKAFGAMIGLVLFGALAVSQAQQVPGEYLDVYIAQVKPEKRAEFDALAKKIAAANRQNNGDVWLAQETMYGRANQVTFVSPRQNYDQVEKAMGAFYAALDKAFGKTSGKMFQDFNECLSSARGEIRQRRFDLSSNPPTDAAAYAKLVGESRWLRTTAVHVRPGEAAKFEDLAKDIKAAREKAGLVTLVSQSVAGTEGTVYYITTLESSMAAFDAIPSMQKMLGEQGYDRFLKVNAEAVSEADTTITRFLPELSNAPEQIAAAAPDYWKPKAANAMNAKATTKPPVVNASQTSKMNDKKPQ